MSLAMDKWSTREQLCLASAVSSSGDQNWMSVSRSLKLLCATANRPPDFFSQKSCAVQYGTLLENVETPKRKKRLNESIAGQSSPATGETPTDLILRRLTEERIQEIQVELNHEQEEYAQLCEDIQLLQSEELNETQLLEMWHSIEKQQEQQRIEEMKLENQLREHEQRKQEMQRNWRHTTSAATTVAVAVLKPALEAISSDMDVEESISSAKPPPLPSNAANANFSQAQHQASSSPTATSPLLSSLLKSPTSVAAPAQIPIQASTARVSAPTITTLLTSGSIPNANQPAITLKSIPPNEAAQLLARPISGPPENSLVVTSPNPQHLLSPSQSAPTLSMLLEKSKGPTHTINKANHAGAVRAGDSKEREAKMAAAHATDFNSEEVPMDIEEDVAVTAAATGATIAATVESDAEPDPNEEQQLLEVFKNIGNIDELGIDVADVIDDDEVYFLKGVDEDLPNEATPECMDFETKLESDKASVGSQKRQTPTIATEMAKNQTLKEDLMPVKEATKDEKTPVNPIILSKESKADDSDKEKTTEIVRSETTSSDDSNDNIPLAAVASLEHKERGHNQDITQDTSFLKEKVESAAKNEETDAVVEASVATKQNSAEDNAADVKEAAELENDTTVEEIDTNVKEKSPAGSVSSDVILIQTDDEESNSEKQTQPEDSPAVEDTLTEEQQDVEKAEHGKNAERHEFDEEEEEVDTAGIVIEAESKDSIPEEKGDESPGVQELSTADMAVQKPRAPTISIADTDDSSTTDISIATTNTATLRREDRTGGSSVTASRTGGLQQNHSRKTAQEQTIRQDSKTDEESITATPVRPPMLRKLRERDRSESPMIDEDSSTPVMDSIPNSPASSERDDRDTRLSKKSLLSIFNVLQHSKNVATLQRAFAEEHVKSEEVCLRPMDMQTIKRSIETGATRSIYELQRDIMLLCQNAFILFRNNTTNYKAAIAFLHEVQGIREFMAHPNSLENTMKMERESKETRSIGGAPLNISSSSSKGRAASRKSQRIT